MSPKKTSPKSSKPMQKVEPVAALPIAPATASPAAALPVAPFGTEEDKITLLTREGLDKLNEELRYLKEVRRKEVAERIHEAISYGDLSENAEYEEAKNEQAFVEGRILELEEKIKHAKIIDDKHKKTTTTVQIGSTVTILHLSGKTKKEEEFSIVGSTEADPLGHKISNESPVGQALLDRKAGDIIRVTVPGGSFQYKVLKVK